MRYLPPTPGLDFADYTTIGCGIARGGPYEYVGQELDQKPECDAWPSRWSQRISHERPDVVLLIVGRWEVVDRMNEGSWTHIGDDGYDAYLRGELNRALDILGVDGCADRRDDRAVQPARRRSRTAACTPRTSPERVDRWNTLVRSVVDERPNASVLDLNKKLSPNGYYQTKVNGIRMRSDGVHPDAGGGRVVDAVADRGAQIRGDFGVLRRRSAHDKRAEVAEVSGRGGRGPGAAAASPGSCPRRRARCSAR